MLRIFSSNNHQEEYRRKGYVIIRGLLTAAEVSELKELALSHTKQYVQPFHASHFSDDEDYKMKVHNVLKQVVFNRVKPYLVNFRAVFGNFMVKQPGDNGFLQMHADWAYVNEPENRSLAVWVPLVDTNEQNGCLGVIDGSHRFMNIVRGPRIQQNSFDHDRQWIIDYGTLLPMKAGDAVVYDHALLHFSYANKTTELRPALNVSMVPENAEIIHYSVPEGETQIIKYAVPSDDFFIHYSNFKTPRLGKVIQTLPADKVKYIDRKMENLRFRRMLERVLPFLQKQFYF